MLTNKYTENLAEFKYLGLELRNQNHRLEEMKMRFN
jgi:hypothetical protein